MIGRMVGHTGGNHRRHGHLVQRPTHDSAARESDSIAAEILLDFQGGGQAKGADRRWRQQTLGCRSSPHVPVGEERGQESVGLQGAAHLAPVLKRLIRLFDEIKRFLACKAASTIVVRVVTGFL